MVEIITYWTLSGNLVLLAYDNAGSKSSVIKGIYTKNKGEYRKNPFFFAILTKKRITTIIYEIESM